MADEKWIGTMNMQKKLSQTDLIIFYIYIALISQERRSNWSLFVKRHRTKAEADIVTTMSKRDAQLVSSHQSTLDLPTALNAGGGEAISALMKL